MSPALWIRSSYEEQLATLEADIREKSAILDRFAALSDHREMVQLREELRRLHQQRRDLEAAWQDAQSFVNESASAADPDA